MIIENWGLEPLYEEAKALVIKTQAAENSWLQRRLKIGYLRAQMILEQLEKDGVVGPFNGLEPRKVLVKT